MKRSSTSLLNMNSPAFSAKRRRATSTYYPPPTSYGRASYAANVAPTSAVGGSANAYSDSLLDASYGSEYSGSSVILDDPSLLPPRVRRNYNCKSCAFATTNPRQFLYHQRDEHGQKGPIHECPFCMYACAHTHKLMRHMNLVHKSIMAEGGASSFQTTYPNPSLHHQLTPSTSIPNLPPSVSISLTGPNEAITSTSSYAKMSDRRRQVPLPPDLEVILVEDDASPMSPGNSGNARKTVRPMLMEPSVVVLPVASSTATTSTLSSSSVASRMSTVRTSRSIAPPPPLYRHNLPRSSASPQAIAGAPYLPPPPPLVSTLRPAVQQQQQARVPPLTISRSRLTTQEFTCSRCSFKSKSKLLVQRHEKVAHLKRKFFCCTKCSYVTNVRSRYTKHVRYHNLPYIKCELCDFSTPYKWNLDRHRRNHLEEGGASERAAGGVASAEAEVYRCERCTFSTLSKQSLSVHLLNHHAEGGGRRRHRRMEESAAAALSPEASSSSRTMEQPSGSKEEDDEIMGKTDEGGTEEDEYQEEGYDEEEDDDDEEGYGGKPYACVECGESFKTVSLLDRHVYEYHEFAEPRCPPPPPPPPPQKSNAAQKSNNGGGSSDGSSSSGAGGGGSGAAAAGGKAKVKCDLCPYEAKWISEVIRHRRVHIHEKPYGCPCCDFRSRWKGDMTRHVSKYHNMTNFEPVEEFKQPGVKRLLNSATGAQSDVNNMDQLLDQSMMVGGEEDYAATYSERQAIAAGDRLIRNGDGVTGHERPLDLTSIQLAGKNGSDGDGPGLLPYLLKMPSRHPALHQGITAPVHLSPSIQLIPTNMVVGKQSSEHQQQQHTVSEPIIRKKYQCPYCPYATPTASRFHMHIVVHMNQKPYMCSECGYRSNWQWDITKHAKMKAPRDPRHLSASMVLVNDTGAKNYEKYDKYIIYETVTKSQPKTANSEPAGVSSSAPAVGTSVLPKPIISVTRTTVPSTAAKPKVMTQTAKSAQSSSVTAKPPPKKVTYKCKYCEFRHTVRRTIVRHMVVHSSNKPFWCGICGQSSNCRNIILRHCCVRHGVAGPIMQRDPDNPDNPKPSQGPDGDLGFEIENDGEPEVAKKDIPPNPAPGLPKSAVSASELHMAESQIENDGPDKDKRHKCTICPYRCRKLFDLRIHSYMHKPHEGAVYKCAFCPFYVSLKRSWFQHMSLHVDKPHEYAKLYLEEGGAGLVSQQQQPPQQENKPQSTAADAGPSVEATKEPSENQASSPPSSFSPNSKRYHCEHCPYTTNSHTTFLYHRQFHRPSRHATYKCTYCSYSVSKSHLLAQHVRIHAGADPSTPPPSSAVGVVEKPVGTSALPTPKLSLDPLDEPLGEASGVPRVWVHRNGVFLKMFQCRHCPHVTKKRAVLMEHEKCHYTRKLDSGQSVFKCQMCNYTCKNAGVLTSHQKVHREQDAKQVYINESQFTPAATLHSRPLASASPTTYKAAENTTAAAAMDASPTQLDRWVKVSSSNPTKVYHPCEKCPAKFVKPHQLIVHRTFHGANLAWRCQYCDYAARHRPHLHNHLRVHTSEYQKEFTKNESSPFRKGDSPPQVPTPPPPAFKMEYESTPAQSPGEAETSQDIEMEAPDVASASVSGSKRHSCHLCPSAFFKYSTLVYHLHLHENDAKYRCRYCSYSVSNIGNLVRHTKVHTNGASKGAQTPVVPEPTCTLISKSAAVAPKPVVSSSPAPLTPLLKRQGRLHCTKCPASFDKQLRFDVHKSLHGSNQRFRCNRCDYSVKFAANLIHHRRMHASADERNRLLAASNATQVTSVANTRALNGGTMISTATPPSSAVAIPRTPIEQSSSCSLQANEVGELMEQPPGSADDDDDDEEAEESVMAAERQQLLFKRLEALRSSSTSVPSAPGSSGNAAATSPRDARKLFRCNRCPYTHQRKDAVQSHMKRHVPSSPGSTCTHCDYTSSIHTFLKEHTKLHFNPFRFHHVDAFAQWEELEIWARSGDVKTLVYRYKRDGKEFTVSDVYDVTKGDVAKKFEELKMANVDEDSASEMKSVTLEGGEDLDGLEAEGSEEHEVVTSPEDEAHPENSDKSAAPVAADDSGQSGLLKPKMEKMSEDESGGEKYTSDGREEENALATEVSKPASEESVADVEEKTADAVAAKGSCDDGKSQVNEKHDEAEKDGENVKENVEEKNKDTQFSKDGDKSPVVESSTPDTEEKLTGEAGMCSAVSAVDTESTIATASEFDDKKSEAVVESSSKSEVTKETSSEPEVSREATSKSDIIPETSSKSDIIPKTSSKSGTIPETSSKSVTIPETSSKSDIVQKTTSKSDVVEAAAAASLNSESKDTDTKKGVEKEQTSEAKKETSSKADERRIPSTEEETAAVQQILAMESNPQGKEDLVAVVVMDESDFECQEEIVTMDLEDNGEEELAAVASITSMEMKPDGDI